MTIALSVNLNKIALLRNSREGNVPDVCEFGRLCLDRGAQGLTVHPRPDQRHIRAADIPALAQLVASYSHAEFNIEGNPFAPAQGSYPGLLQLVEQSRPHQCTLVPDSDAQLTSDHGFDLTTSAERLSPIIEQLHHLGVRVSLFMDPDVKQISLAKELGADRIELYTGPFAWAFARDRHEGEAAFEQHCAAADHGAALGLGINAGHDLDLENMTLYRNLPHLAEVSIGHVLTVDALRMGYAAAVEAYLELCRPDFSEGTKKP